MTTLKSSLILSLIDNVSAPARRISGVMAGFQKAQLGMLSAMRGAGGLLALGAGYVGVTQGISGTAGAALEFEAAFADVRKVLNGSDEQLENIRRSIIGMSKELPIAASGIAEIYAAAGQSNIPIQEINKFAEMVAKVSTAWDVPVAETGDALAKIKTQLNLGVTEVGLFADSLNHLANNTAANAPNLLEYTTRVAATGEMFGFSAQETLAFGGAMISAGAESEVAATSFRNMGRALTKGTEATKMQRTAYKRLGLDAVKTAKNMQKNALGTTLDVIERIQALPEWERISMASALFGDEARALMPAINNSTELRRQLGLVGDQANYAGSAFKEYTVRASTVGNVLQILRNKFADLFRSIGDRMLPSIKEAALGIGDIIDSLGERGHIFAQMEAAFKGFAQGMGAEGGIRSMINDLGDLLFGAADGSAAADKIGRVFVKFKEWGAAVRELTTAIANNPLAQFFASLAPYGFQIMLWSTGILLLAGTIRKLASALMFLSGASAIIGVLKMLKELADIFNKAKPNPALPVPRSAKPGTRPGPTGPKIPQPRGGFWRGLKGGLLPALIYEGGETAIRSGFQSVYGENYREPPGLTDSISGTWNAWRDLLGSGGKPYAAEADAARAEQARFNVLGGGNAITPESLRAAMAPQGVQDVRNVEPPRDSLSVMGNISISGVSDPQAAATAAAKEFEARMRRIMSEYAQ